MLVRRPRERALLPTDARAPRRPARGLRPLLIALAFALPPGTADAQPTGRSRVDPPRRGAPEAVARVAPAEPRIYAYAGRQLLVPIVPALDRGEEAERRPWMPAQAPAVRFVTDAALDASVYYIAAEPSGAAEPAPWLPPALSWSAHPLAEVSNAAQRGAEIPTDRPGFWALVIDLPPHAAGRIIRLDGAEMPVSWVNDPPAAVEPARPPRPRTDPGALRALGRIIEGEARDPALSWRIRLLEERLPADRLWDGPPARPSGHPVLLLMAEQHERRWRSALAALARSGPETASDLLARLTAVVRLPGGALVPAWPLDGADLVRLRSALIDPRATDAARLDAAQAWLGANPEAVAWIIDESADAPTDGGRAVTLAVADLRGRGTAASAAPEGRPARSSARIDGHESAVFTIEAPDEDGARLVARAGEWRQALPYLPRPLTVAPPGALLGPLLPRWSMVQWMLARPDAVEPDWATAALLQPSPDGSRWELYVECRREPGETRPEAVTVHLGPFGNAAARLVVRPEDGRAERDRWTATVAIPHEAIEPGSLLRIGLERTDPRGLRSSWPRPVTPDQTEPGRVILDLSSWSGAITPGRPDHESAPAP